MATVIDPHITLGELITSHPDLARELERRSFDYCCGGGRTLAEVSGELGLDVDVVVAELTAVATAPPAPWADLDAGALADHVESTHHAYLHEEMPRVAALAAKVRSVHGANHPELAEVEATFTTLRAELDPHMAKEERVLFPLIRQLAAGESPSMPGGTIHNPISMLIIEHDQAGELLERLRELTTGFTVPADGCASYAALYAALAEMEHDTHIHAHKENNRLFPMAVDLEAAAQTLVP
jgi:regulator of cell morphogenesis and NO signaling